MTEPKLTSNKNQDKDTRDVSAIAAELMDEIAAYEQIDPEERARRTKRMEECLRKINAFMHEIMDEVDKKLQELQNLKQQQSQYPAGSEQYKALELTIAKKSESIKADMHFLQEVTEYNTSKTQDRLDKLQQTVNKELSGNKLSTPADNLKTTDSNQNAAKQSWMKAPTKPELDDSVDLRYKV